MHPHDDTTPLSFRFQEAEYLGFHMKYCLFLYQQWFFQNLAKSTRNILFMPTNRYAIHSRFGKMKSLEITLFFLSRLNIFLKFYWNTKWHNQRNLQIGLSLTKISYFYLKWSFIFVQLVLDDPVELSNSWNMYPWYRGLRFPHHHLLKDLDLDLTVAVMQEGDAEDGLHGEDRLQLLCQIKGHCQCCLIFGEFF